MGLQKSIVPLFGILNSESRLKHDEAASLAPNFVLRTELGSAAGEVEN